MRRGAVGALFGLLVVLGVLGFWSIAGAQGAGPDLAGVTAVVTDSTSKAKEIAAGVILLLSALLAIGLVVMLYKNVGNK